MLRIDFNYGWKFAKEENSAGTQDIVLPLDAMIWERRSGESDYFCGKV